MSVRAHIGNSKLMLDVIVVYTVKKNGKQLAWQAKPIKMLGLGTHNCHTSIQGAIG